MRNRICITATIVVFIMLGMDIQSIMGQQVEWAGCRQSVYGVSKQRPTSTEWGYIGHNMAQCFPGAKPTLVWIVGTINTQGTCELEFASGGKTYPNVAFMPINGVDHESSLTYFDQNNINVFLQVESGLADMNNLIEVIMDKFGKHSCVIGFGVDVEWYKAKSCNTPNSSGQIPDAEAESWDKKLKSYNPNLRMFMKHWETKVMPTTFRSDIIFLNDSQGFKSIDEFATQFAQWAQKFNQNAVAFQYGYDADGKWWKSLQKPPKAMGDAILQKLQNKEQKIGMFWVDFTLRAAEVSFLFQKPNTAIQESTKSILSNGLNLAGAYHAKSRCISVDFSAPGASAATVSLCSVTGQTLYSARLSGAKENVQIPAQTLASGLYILTLKQGALSVSHRLVVGSQE
ncbi:MAG: T9SS type A sorting domain-containing protein [Chitinivibrionales bacterium]|nr:T9SS type A sorting domain-containing protein [Chitinivibrionales bacterium]